MRVDSRARCLKASWAVGWILCGLLAGCESPGWAQRLDDAFAIDPKVTEEEVERHRTGYVANGNPDDLHWLLRNQVHSGISYEGVCRILGEKGTRVTHDRAVKTSGGNYQSGDDVYSFGPDRNGQALFLVFRENKLVNFDPSEFDGPGRSRRSRREDDESK